MYKVVQETRYEKGRVDGFVDGCIISQPIHEDRHTYAKYVGVNAKYLSVIFNRSPSDYQEGYGIGLDLAATYLGIGPDRGEE